VNRLHAQRASASSTAYTHLLQGVLSGDQALTLNQKNMLAAYRKQHDISDELHHKTLLQIGWTDEDFERGSNHRGWFDSWFSAADRKREQQETSSASPRAD
jgi:hypothetical protein